MCQPLLSKEPQPCLQGAWSRQGQGWADTKGAMTGGGAGMEQAPRGACSWPAVQEHPQGADILEHLLCAGHEDTAVMKTDHVPA